MARNTRAELKAGRSDIIAADPRVRPRRRTSSTRRCCTCSSRAGRRHRGVQLGAVDFTAALAKVAEVLGYHVTVPNAREIFATRRRFPMADSELQP